MSQNLTGAQAITSEDVVQLVLAPKEAEAENLRAEYLRRLKEENEPTFVDAQDNSSHGAIFYQYGENPYILKLPLESKYPSLPTMS